MAKENKHKAIFEKIKKKHFDIIEKLLEKPHLEKIKKVLLKDFEGLDYIFKTIGMSKLFSENIREVVTGHGELWSAQILNELLKQKKIGTNFNSNDYVSMRFFALSRDGVNIPVSIVYKKGLKRDGMNPLLIYAYGAYGDNVNPYFEQEIFSLLDRGFVYAVANVRGGSEMGQYWYDNGKMLNKKNTFYDFIDVTKYLIKEKYTSPKKVYAWGMSAGGLLVGAVANMRPDLYNGIYAQVPFVDTLTTMLDPSIPLTIGEYDEWGNPEDKVYYDYIKSYSPYDNIVAQDYPHMFVTGGFYDSQVQYWEPAKWVAKLRTLKTDNNLLLLHTDMNAGHGGASGRIESLRQLSFGFSFLVSLEKGLL